VNDAAPIDVAEVLARHNLQPGLDGHLAVNDVARAYGVHPETIRRWYDVGIVTGYRYHGGKSRRGARRITPESAAALLAGRKA
jgi:hypothetical protein